MSATSEEKYGMDLAGLVSMKPVVLDLLEMEYAWFMKKLPLKYKKQVHPEAWDPKSEEPFPATTVLGGVEVALVIAGLKPCVVYSCGTCVELGKLWFDGVITPWVQKHAEALEKISFVATTTPKHTVAQFMSEENEDNAHFGMNAAFLYRETHPLLEHCKMVFSTVTVTQGELQKAFGYPTETSPDLTIHYQVAPSAVNALLGLEEDVVIETEFIGLEYDCPAKPSSLVAAGRHFCEYREALGHLGIPIALDANAELTPESLAFLFLAAADGKISNLMKLMLEEDAVWRRPQHDLAKTFEFMTNLEPKWEEMTQEWEAAGEL